MHPVISLTAKTQQIDNLVLVLSGMQSLPRGLFTNAEKEYINQHKEDRKKEIISFNRLDYWIYLYFIKKDDEKTKLLEECRKAGDQVAKCLNDHKARRIVVFDTEARAQEILAFAEGMALGSYQFLKYKKDKKDKHSLKEIQIYSGAINQASIHHLNILINAVYQCRTLINEPNSYLSAPVFAREVETMVLEYGVKVEILNRKKLEALKMGGILAVNKGSAEPPTFTILEWNPADAKNTKPIVFVGKGIVYDSGGMNLKTGSTMQDMKDDMSGAAAVASVILAIAKAGLPVFVVGLLPATDNRPGVNAMVPGDVIRMHNGTNVEVIDTDAEGRLILADALSYASKYDPCLVIDLATLTGSAQRAVGKVAAVVMQSKAEKEMELLKESGFEVYERLIEFPMWEEYGEMIKSELADLKNLGPPEAGSITAGKFLEHFTRYPYIHIDIAGPAFLEKRDSYRGQGGTGFGVRLLFDFVKKWSLATTS